MGVCRLYTAHSLSKSYSRGEMVTEELRSIIAELEHTSRGDSKNLLLRQKEYECIQVFISRTINTLHVSPNSSSTPQESMSFALLESVHYFKTNNFLFS